MSWTSLDLEPSWKVGRFWWHRTTIVSRAVRFQKFRFFFSQFQRKRCVHRGQFSCRMNDFSQVRRVCFSMALCSAMKSSAMMSSAMMFSFLGYEFQTRELQIVRQMVCSFFGAIFLSNCPKFFPNKSGVIKQVTPPKFKQTTISWFFFRQNKPPGQTLGRIVVF